MIRGPMLGLVGVYAVLWERRYKLEHGINYRDERRIKSLV